MNGIRCRYLVVLLSVIVGQWSCLAWADPPPLPDLTHGGKKDDKHDWNLGPTGARGWMWGFDLSTAKARQILITEVEKGSPADGILQVGDVILGCSNRPFDSDARVVFGNAITRAERAESHGRLRLMRWRKGQTETVMLQLKPLGDYSDTSPADCPKTATIVEAAIAHLLKVGLSNDFYGKVNALGLLATGREELQPVIKKLAHEVGAKNLKLKTSIGSLESWDMSMSNIFLTEYYLSTHDEFVLPAIREYSRRLAAGQTISGSWGHGMAVPGVTSGYGVVNQVGLQCWYSLELAEKCGVKELAVQEATKKARQFFRFFMHKGSIPYGDHPPFYYLHDNNGKNALAALTFDVVGNNTATQYFSRSSVAAFEEREFGHTGNYFSYMWGPLGVARSGNQALAAHLKQQRWYYDLARRWDGGFRYQGGAGNDDSYEGEMTGSFLLTYSIPQRKLFLTGRDIKPANTLSTDDLATTIESGRGFDNAHLNDCYARKQPDVLLELLGSWSPTVRYRAASALGIKKAAVVPQVMAMLESKDINRRYGACQALEQLGSASAPAVDALMTQLQRHDFWLQSRAADALAAIGEPARKAVPVLLRLVLDDKPNDSREMSRKYIGFSLFTDSQIDNLPARGLLAESIRGVDKQTLLAAMKKMLAIDDGLARGRVAHIYSKLSDRELESLWPDILKSTANYAPSGEMFADEIRLAGLKIMAEHHIKDGLRAGVDYAKHQNIWASEIRMSEILDQVVMYGVAAKEFLPELRELVNTCRKEDFPDEAKQQKIAALQAGIKKIESTKDKPALRSINAP